MSEIKRKLATIEKVTNIRPITGADNIEQCTIRGWNVVIKKGDFKEGDLGIYCEIDSLMPQRPEFEFLAPRKYRIKTTKLRGVISQGITFPLSILPMSVSFLDTPSGLAVEINPEIGFIEPVGADVTDTLGIIKYDPPIPACLDGIAKGNFPSHSIKTDENRIQNLIDSYKNYHDNYTWVATEKLDGSSCSYAIYDDIFGVSSRNLELLESEGNSLWKVARVLNIEKEMRIYMKEHGLKALTLQGELIGEGIQSNKYKIKGQTIRLFRMFDPLKYQFLPWEQFDDACVSMGLKTVPVIEKDMTLPDTIDELIKLADGRSALRDTAREGIVFVAESEIFPDTRPIDDYQGRLSFKVISNKFILKHDE